MQSPRSLSILALLGLGVLFAIANLWFAAARSTIPLELHGTVMQKKRLIEKTPGVDDVYLVTLDSNRRIQVDGDVFDAMFENASIHKQAWTRTLYVDGKRETLGWSQDFQGMCWSMPLTVLVFVLVSMMQLLSLRFQVFQ